MTPPNQMHAVMAIAPRCTDVPVSRATSSTLVPARNVSVIQQWRSVYAHTPVWGSAGNFAAVAASRIGSSQSLCAHRRPSSRRNSRASDDLPCASRLNSRTAAGERGSHAARRSSVACP
jgi:hypothetical protein